MSPTPQYGQAQAPVAIVGMACVFPGAPTLDSFWTNIVSGIDSVREVSAAEWSGPGEGGIGDGSGAGTQNIYCRRGGFITEYAEFDPLEFGIMPSSLNGSDPDQFIALSTAAAALADAGYHHRSFDGERAEIIIGRTMAPAVGSLNFIQRAQTVGQVIEILRVLVPQLEPAELADVAQRLRSSLAPSNPDTIPACMPNVLAGRIASKLGFRGRNLILDAACASSLIAVETAMQGLRSGQSDLAIAGGIHVNSNPFFYQMFCDLGALSRTGVIRPFDDRADGTILGEGCGMAVLKRLDDAERAGDRIYAVIRGAGSSSDGRGGAALAPNEDGEALAMRRAYEEAGISPATVELLEAHGTGTPAGDRAELNAVRRVFGEAGGAGRDPWCAVGSVKSMIGHTQAASGMAGLIKIALALHHKVLPPTLHVEQPCSRFDWSTAPCYINSQARPWTSNRQAEGGQPRRAAVSAFGFGGVNAHAVLEEHGNPAERRHFRPEPEKAGRRPRQAVKLLLRYPELKAGALEGLTLRSTPGPVRLDEQESKPETGSAVMAEYIRTLGTFHQKVMSVHENVMLSYLDGE